MFDESKYYLGKLCVRGHDYAGTGMSLRKVRDNECGKCCCARAKIYYEKHREKISAKKSAFCKKHRARLNEYAREYYRDHHGERLKYVNNYRAKHLEEYRASAQRCRERYPERYKILNKKNSKKACVTLSGNYVKGILNRITGLRFEDIPPELIEFKRAHLKLTRLLRKEGYNG